MYFMNTSTDLLFTALGDRTRRNLFQYLAQQGEQSVHAMTAQAGISQPAVSKHLALLKRAGLVQDRRAGRETFYCIQPDGLAPLIDWMSFYSEFWNKRLDSLEDLLGRMDT